MRTSSFVIWCGTLLCTASLSLADPSAQMTTDSSVTPMDEIVEIKETVLPGSHATVTKTNLERREHDDIHDVLTQVAGVYVRDEDGFGLRPNIGMRGAAAERSAKITLMEDGVLIAPAPYSAPAAYYFPLVTRMSRVDVVKGPAAVAYGPNTVGGAIDLVGEPMPPRRAGYLDSALGSDGYRKFHARAAERWRHGGLMAEYVSLHSDGFKSIDNGGNSGFDKNDAQLWGRISSAATSHTYHQLDAKIGYGDETSNETYTGLTDVDFAQNSQRRYAATQLDQMNWGHWRFRLAHRVEVGASWSLETTAYHHRFDRAWGKVDAFVGNRDLADILASPQAGANPIYYAVLTGQANSSSPEDELLLGTNDRFFISQGVQSSLVANIASGPFTHQISSGIRLHYDMAHRRRTEDGYQMFDGALYRSQRPQALVLDTRAETVALALFAQDKIDWRRLRLTLGARVETIAPSFIDRQSGDKQDDLYAVFIPGGGVEVALHPQLFVLAGVNRGFVPAAPSASSDIEPELSVNYEAGLRWLQSNSRADLLGFFSDYHNLKGTCTLSSGCAAVMDGVEFNGGQAQVWGVELQASHEFFLSQNFRVPVALSYTLTRGTFHNDFDSDFAAWGEVEAGDSLPYLPEQQGSLAAALQHPFGELAAALRWQSAARDIAGQGEIPENERIQRLWTIGISLHKPFATWGEGYLTCDNIFDEQVIVSRRPYGARPNAPRHFTLGLKARF